MANVFPTVQPPAVVRHNSLAAAAHVQPVAVDYGQYGTSAAMDYGQYGTSAAVDYSQYGTSAAMDYGQYGTSAAMGYGHSQYGGGHSAGGHGQTGPSYGTQYAQARGYGELFSIGVCVFAEGICVSKDVCITAHTEEFSATKRPGLSKRKTHQ